MAWCSFQLVWGVGNPLLECVQEQRPMNAAVTILTSVVEFVAMVADKTGQKASISDYVVYAEMYYFLLKELHDKGSLPVGWKEKTKEMFGETNLQ